VYLYLEKKIPRLGTKIRPIGIFFHSLEIASTLLRGRNCKYIMRFLRLPGTAPREAMFG